jgi:peptidoglycan/LPS O-acetylase OafA/YrhL
MPDSALQAEKAAQAARRPELDGLRGLAALAVLVFHCWLYTMAVPDAGRKVGGLGIAYSNLRLGLVLFFVLSGFLLFGPWVRAALEERAAPRVVGYFKRRALRVLPAYYLALVGAIILLWPHGGSTGVRLPEPGELWTFFALVPNYFDGPLMTLNPPVWTLIVEISFYAVLPLLGWVALRLAPTRWAQAMFPLALLIAGIAFNAWLTDHRAEAPNQLAKLLPAMLPYFAVGMFAAVVAYGRRPSRRAGWILLAAGAVLVYANVRFKLAATGTKETVILRDLLAAVGFAAIVAGAAAPQLRRVVGSRPLVALGSISYAVYLWHVPLLLWLRAEGLLPSSPIAALLVVLPPTLAISTASWLLLERPAIALGHRGRDASTPSKPLRPAAQSAR